MVEDKASLLGLWAAIAFLFAAVLAVLFWFDPAQHAIYPVCHFYRLTGLLCPGCGGLRATHQLLHGHLAEALRLNAFFVLLTPLLAWWIARYFYLKLKGRSASFTIRPRWLWTFLGLLLAFGIARNLPWG